MNNDFKLSALESRLMKELSDIPVLFHQIIQDNKLALFYALEHYFDITKKYILHKCCSDKFIEELWEFGIQDERFVYCCLCRIAIEKTPDCICDILISMLVDQCTTNRNFLFKLACNMNIASRISLDKVLNLYIDLYGDNYTELDEMLESHDINQIHYKRIKQIISTLLSKGLESPVLTNSLLMLELQGEFEQPEGYTTINNSTVYVGFPSLGIADGNIKFNTISRYSGLMINNMTFSGYKNIENYLTTSNNFTYVKNKLSRDSLLTLLNVIDPIIAYNLILDSEDLTLELAILKQESENKGI